MSVSVHENVHEVCQRVRVSEKSSVCVCVRSVCVHEVHCVGCACACASVSVRVSVGMPTLPQPSVCSCLSPRWKPGGHTGTLVTPGCCDSFSAPKELGKLLASQPALNAITGLLLLPRTARW